MGVQATTGAEGREVSLPSAGHECVEQRWLLCAHPRGHPVIHLVRQFVESALVERAGFQRLQLGD